MYHLLGDAVSLGYSAKCQPCKIGGDIGSRSAPRLQHSRGLFVGQVECAYRKNETEEERFLPNMTALWEKPTMRVGIQACGFAYDTFRYSMWH